MSMVQYTANGTLRSLWPQKDIYNQMFRESPALGVFAKDTSFGEEHRYIIVEYGYGHGMSATLEDAFLGQGANKYAKFDIQTRSFYATFSLERKLLRAANETGNKALIVDPLKAHSKAVMQGTRNKLSGYIHGDGVGVLGQISAGSDVTTQTITLQGADASVVRKLQAGMNLETEPTGATGGTVNTGYVTLASDPGGTDAAPTLTITQTSWRAAIGSCAAGDRIYLKGTYDKAPLFGFDAWFPDWSGGSPSAFAGVTRSTSPKNLAGSVLDAKTTPMKPTQRLQRAARLSADAGGTSRADTYLVSTANWESFQNELSAAGRLVYTKVPAASVGKYSFGIEYTGLQFIGPQGAIDIIADPWMSDSVERLLPREACTIASCGDLLQWEPDASPSAPMLNPTSDSVQVRLVGDMSFYCEAPGKAVRVKVA